MDHASHAAHMASASAYAGEEMRAIKALSPSEISGLLEGAGMGFAMAAELNGYPGPGHVLELADALQLSEAQLGETREVHRRMQDEARALGAALVSAEAELDREFHERTITSERLSAAMGEIAELRGQVRESHLRAHLEQTAILSEAQIAEYDVLRGYAGGSASDHAPNAPGSAPDSGHGPGAH